MTDESHVVETDHTYFSVKRQMTIEAFIKATGNKCTEFGENAAHNEVV